MVARQQAARQGRWLVCPVKSLLFARPAQRRQTRRPTWATWQIEIVIENNSKEPHLADPILRLGSHRAVGRCHRADWSL